MDAGVSSRRKVEVHVLILPPRNYSFLISVLDSFTLILKLGEWRFSTTYRFNLLGLDIHKVKFDVLYDATVRRGVGEE